MTEEVSDSSDSEDTKEDEDEQIDVEESCLENLRSTKSKKTIKYDNVEEEAKAPPGSLEEDNVSKSGSAIPSERPSSSSK